VDDPSHRRARLALIEGLQVQATTLLWAATDDSLKTRIRLAMLDLDKAVNWLKQDVIELRPEHLRLVDATIDLATRKMAFVAKALDDLKSTRKATG
jgi:predicted membrane GTPase involved in stress response